jgi:hypothetical protein
MDWLLFAMANWHLGNHDQAKTWYSDAVSKMNEDGYFTDYYERSFRAEVESLLGTTHADGKRQSTDPEAVTNARADRLQERPVRP